MKTRWLSGMVVVLGLTTLAGCPEDTKNTQSSVSNKTSASNSAKPPTSSSAASSASSATAEAPEADFKALMQSGEEHGVLTAQDLDVAAKVDTAKAEAINATLLKSTTSLDLPGGLAILDPGNGWKSKTVDGAFIVSSPDDKISLIYMTVTSGDDAKQKLDKMVDSMKLKNVTWKKAKDVKLGPDQLPARLRGGKGAVNDASAELLLALIDTDKPEKILAVAIQDSTAAKDAEKAAGSAFLNVRKK